MIPLLSWPGRGHLKPALCLLLFTAPLMLWGQSALLTGSAPSGARAAERAHRDLAACRAYKVTGLPGSHTFASDFIEAMVTDPDPPPADRNTVWGLTADLGSRVPAQDQAIYLSKSTNGGETWTEVARLSPRYFDAQISEGQRNGLSVSPGGKDFVITTQDGAFQVFPQKNPSTPIVKRIDGPRVPAVRPDITIAKKTGDPVRAGVVLMTADGEHMVIAYGYFDNNPQLFTYHRDAGGAWVEDGTLPHLPTNLDIFSMQFEHPRMPNPDSLYVGTGDQAFHLTISTGQWTRVAGVGPDSAIHSMSVVDGLHIAACWGVYNPINPDLVSRVTTAHFLLHRGRDVSGPNIRAYAIAVDPLQPSHEVLATITGVYISSDSGQSWTRLNNLPDGEFHSAHFNPDGTVIVSGYVGTFLVNPFSRDCAPRLETRAH